MPDLSFREKSILGSLIATVCVSIGYFTLAVPLLLQENPSYLDFVGPVIGAVVLLIVVQIVYAILIAISSREEPRDERDRLIDLRAARLGYVTLSYGVAALIVGLAVAPLVGRWASPLVVLHALMLLSTVAEVVKFAAQFVYYRCSV